MVLALQRRCNKCRRGCQIEVGCVRLERRGVGSSGGIIYVRTARWYWSPRHLLPSCALPPIYTNININTKNKTRTNFNTNININTSKQLLIFLPSLELCSYVVGACLDQKIFLLIKWLKENETVTQGHLKALNLTVILRCVGV